MKSANLLKEYLSAKEEEKRNAPQQSSEKSNEFTLRAGSQIRPNLNSLPNDNLMII